MGTKRTGRKVYREQIFRCDRCQTVIPGRDMTCPNCTNGKDESETYETPENPVVITDPVIIAMAKAGANWRCECTYDNRATVQNCERCGRPRYEPTHPDEERPDDPPPRREARSLPPPWPEDPIPPQDRRSNDASNLLVIGAVGMSLVLVATLLWWLLVPREVNVPVARISWGYRAQLQQFVTLHDKGWDPPPDAYNTTCDRQQRGTEKCNPTQCNPHPVDCNPRDCEPCTTSVNNCVALGNGIEECDEVITCATCYDTCTEYETCYEQCPVYGDWCAYDHDVWTSGRTDETYGTTHETYWPSLEANGPKQKLIKTEHYSVFFVIDGDELKYEPESLEEFRRYDNGAMWTVEVNRLGHVTPLAVVSG